ncbi:hypothetical protein V6N11_058693 [Hibiscus sabdariffa]|uniref:Uncharacterized protein n=1 Tax=Hibiscus sabdariffa TaxID=183260 RepID=A0ABR2U500_9ROSI
MEESDNKLLLPDYWVAGQKKCLLSKFEMYVKVPKMCYVSVDMLFVDAKASMCQMNPTPNTQPLELTPPTISKNILSGSIDADDDPSSLAAS